MRVRSGAEVNDVLLTNNSGVQGLPGDEGAWTATGMGPSPHAQGERRTPAVPSRRTRGPRRVAAGPATPPKSGHRQPAVAGQPSRRQLAVQRRQLTVSKSIRIQGSDP